MASEHRAKNPRKRIEECEARLCEDELSRQKQATPKVAFVFDKRTPSKESAEAEKAGKTSDRGMRHE